MMLQVAKLSPHARIPTRGSGGAAGLDVYSAYDYDIPAKGRVLCLLDIQIACPTGCYARIAPRSGLAYHHFIDVGAGVIDPDYRGNVGVLLFNFNDCVYKVKRGDRIAQIILERIIVPVVEEVDILSSTTDRGRHGYGSTGK